jgi:hypothetical protein
LKAPNLLLQASLVLIFLGPTMPLHAQVDPRRLDRIWYVCNKGTVAVEVCSRNSRPRHFAGLQILLGHRGRNRGSLRTAMNVVKDPFGESSYLAFGLADSKGVLGIGHHCPGTRIYGSIKYLFTRDEKS